MTRFGGQSELVAVKATQIFEKPDSFDVRTSRRNPGELSDSLRAPRCDGIVALGESVLIHNAGGGVGLAALDIAKKIGAQTFGTASPSKHQFLKERGLDHPIDYRGRDWLPELQQLTDGRGVDLVIDPIGGKHWKKSYAALRHTGGSGMFGVSTASANGLAGKFNMLEGGDSDCRGFIRFRC